MDVFKGVKKVLLSSLEHAIVLTKSNSIITVKCSGNYKTKGEFNCHSKNEPHKLKKDEKVLDFSQGKKDGEFLMVTSIGKSTAFYILSATKGHSSRTLEDKEREEEDRETIEAKSVIIDNEPFFVTIRQHDSSKFIYIYSTHSGKLEDLKKIQHFKFKDILH